jgi:Leucine-rich repeat (LRR) protein
MFLCIRRNFLQHIHQTAFVNACTTSKELVLDLSFNHLINATELQLSLSQVPYLYLLNLENNLLSDIPANLFQAESQLWLINMASNNISFVHPDTFRYATKLLIIDMGNNSISELSDSIFDGLSSLLFLKLDSNRLRSLPQNIFRNVDNLKVLQMNNNQINLASHQLAMPAGLQWLDLSNNELTSPSIGFTPLIQVNLLFLSGNHFSQINNESLALFPNVAMLALDNCSIANVQRDAFSKHRLLRYLRLNDNPLQFDPQEAPFEQDEYRNIDFLDLSNTGISSAVHLFDGALAHVNNLVLRENPILELPDQSIPSMYYGQTVYSLNELSMSDCSLESFTPDSLKYAIWLRIVDFRRNNLVEFEPFDVSLWFTALTYDVLLDDNPVECSCRMKWLKYNHHYKLTYCWHAVRDEFVLLSTIPDEEFLCKLEDDCRLTDSLRCACYTDDQTHIGKPVLLTCSNKSVDNFPANLPPSVSVAYFDGNNLKSLNGSRRVNFQLQKLFLDRNKIAHIESEAFDAFPNLAVLSLKENRLRSIGTDWFSNLFLLDILDLSNNFLTVIESGALSNLHSLVELSLRGNWLKNLSDATMSELDSMSQLKNLSLDNNPWNCSSCDNATFKHWLTSHNDIIVNASYITCDNGTSIWHLPDDAFTCYDKRERVFVKDVLAVPLSVSLTFTFLAIIIVIGLLLAFKYRLVVKAWLYTRYRWTPCRHRTESDKCKCDAVIVHDEDDPGADRLSESIEQRLLKFEPRFQLLVHQKRCLPNANRMIAIAQHIDDSKRTVIVINGDEFESNDFMKHAFQYAYDRMTKIDNRHRVIIVTTNEVDLTSLCQSKKLDANLRAFLTARKPLLADERWFWQKLFYFMPRSGFVDCIYSA